MKNRGKMPVAAVAICFGLHPSCWGAKVGLTWPGKSLWQLLGLILSPVTPKPDELDRVLEELASGEEVQRLFELVALSSDASPQDKDKLLNYVLNSRHSKGPDRLNLLVLAALLLTDGHGQIAEQSSRELDAALAAPDTAASTLYRATRARIENEMTALRQAHAAELERERREQERLRLQVRERNAELERIGKRLRACIQAQIKHEAN